MNTKEYNNRQDRPLRAQYRPVNQSLPVRIAAYLAQNAAQRGNTR
jgi:hypothetical protein